MGDNWDFYFCHVEGHPASIFVDLGLLKDVPLTGLDDMAWLRLYLRQPRGDGLSSNEEYDRLCEIENALNQAIANADTRIIYVGRNTSNGCRDFYFYAENGNLAESCLSMALVPFPEYEFEVGSRSDPEWKTYREFLYPSPRAYQTIMNHRVLDSLKQYGDQHDIEREVTHWIYFQSSADRDRFLTAALQKGYKLVSQKDDAKGERKFGLMLSKVHTVDFGTINDVVLELFDLAGECSGDYDGWETSVEKGE